MNLIVKANLELLIAEIQELKPSAEITALLNTWVKANDLHPEKVQTFKSTKELNDYLSKEV